MSNKSRIALIFVVVFTVTLTYKQIAACSSRTIPKPRPSTLSSSSLGSGLVTSTAPPATTTTATTTTTTTQRPNITFPTYSCPPTYDTYYCLNEARCFSVKIADSVMYNCVCSIGFVGARCEYKDLDGSYVPKRKKPILEKASIASGATCALLFVLFICLTLYLRYDQKVKSFDGDEDVDANCSKCRYCNDNCCYGDTDLIATAENYRISTLRQHIETVPMSFAIKRSTKL